VAVNNVRDVANVAQVVNEVVAVCHGIFTYVKCTKYSVHKYEN
jgi:hypothetical protein